VNSDPFGTDFPDPGPQSLHLWPQLGLQQMKYSVMACSPLVGACKFKASEYMSTAPKSSAAMTGRIHREDRAVIRIPKLAVPRSIAVILQKIRDTCPVS